MKAIRIEGFDKAGAYAGARVAVEKWGMYAFDSGLLHQLGITGPGMLFFAPDGDESQRITAVDWHYMQKVAERISDPPAQPQGAAKHLESAPCNAKGCPACAEDEARDNIPAETPQPQDAMRNLIETAKIASNFMHPLSAKLRDEGKAAEAELAGEKIITLVRGGYIGTSEGWHFDAGRYAIRRLADAPEPEKVRPWIVGLDGNVLACPKCRATQGNREMDACFHCHVPFGEPRPLPEQPE